MKSYSSFLATLLFLFFKKLVIYLSVLNSYKTFLATLLLLFLYNLSKEEDKSFHGNDNNFDFTKIYGYHKYSVGLAAGTRRKYLLLMCIKWNYQNNVDKISMEASL